MHVLFVCTGNTCRSPMGAGYFRYLCKKNGKNDITVESAGTSACEGALVSEHAVKVMEKFGVNISDHLSSKLTVEKIDSADLIVVMSALHKQVVGEMRPPALKKTHTIFEFVNKTDDIFDPLGGDLELYLKCFKEMKKALDNLFCKIDELKKIKPENEGI